MVYIDRDKLLNELPNDLPYKASVKRVLIQAEEADVVEVKHGEWKPTNIPAYFCGVIYECSLCGAKDGDHTKILGKYCWRCGAKMDGGKDENV